MAFSHAAQHPRAHGGSARGRQVSSRRVRDLLLASIRTGSIDADAPLVEEELMQMFDSSRGSVRAALGELSEAGRLVRRPRVGTRLHRKDLGIQLADFSGTNGQSVEIKVTEQRLVPTFPLVSERLDIHDDHVRLVENIFIANDEVIGLRNAYFSPRFDADPTALVGEPLTMAKTIAEFFRVTPGTASVSIGAELSDDRTSQLLGIEPGQSLLSRDVVYSTADGRPFQIVFDRFRADRVRLESDLGLSDWPDRR
ncbi:GntR family transcriptional regulator [Gordonia rhizosphera]|uniref:Putative GntR family transcriptional regulator n=1 Tax=Gordonia rhizosphera NBRC 16068 TaxID=1108045 RepID=K6WFT6_9ACTN|nr:GntR family transcriptional regulator [Gordonia rhizosphera]GAB91037.1 putative GntR family transcriptional regulator [Gordonia rhizosphera NBRC 16068]